MGLPTKARKAGKGASVITVNKDDFFHYTNFRILDSIGYPGAYRKFMLKRKEQGADWAVRMNEHVLSVQRSIKDLSILELFRFTKAPFSPPWTLQRALWRTHRTPCKRALSAAVRLLFLKLRT